MKRILLACAVALSLAAPPALATLQISANINGTIFNCADNQACDTNATIGQLVLNNLLFGGVEIVGSSQFQQIGLNNFLNTSSFQVINHNLVSAVIFLAISGTDFLGPVTQYAASGSGTWQNANGSTIGLEYYGDAANTQGADTPNDLPGILLTSFNDVANGAADAFAFNQSGVFGAAGLYSMSLGTSGTLAGSSGQPGQDTTLVGRSQTIITTQALLPEPGTLMLLGISLLGLFGILGVTRKQH